MCPAFPAGGPSFEGRPSKLRERACMGPHSTRRLTANLGAAQLSGGEAVMRRESETEARLLSSTIVPFHAPEPLGASTLSLASLFEHHARRPSWR